MFGYICRSKGSNTVCITVGRKKPQLKQESGWFVYIPGWFATMPVRQVKKVFGFTVAPGTYKRINISICERVT